MRKKRIPEALVRSVMSLCERTKTRVKVDCELSEEFEAKVMMHQGSVLPPILPAVVVDVIAQSELLYAYDILLMREKNEGHGNKSLKWKEALESKG